MSQHRQPITKVRRRKQRAFTLLEVVMALAVTALLLTAAMSLLTSISSIWLQRETRYFFVSHVNGVDAFLTHLLNPAVDMSQTTQSVTAVVDSEEAVADQQEVATDVVDAAQSTDLAATTEAQVEWAHLADESNFSSNEPMLRILVEDAPALFFQGEERPLGLLSIFLEFDPELGLSALWTDSLAEEPPSSEEDYQRTLITRYISQVQYVYWDVEFERWEFLDQAKELDDQSFELPEFLKLTFTYEGAQVERLIEIPAAPAQVLLF